MIDNDNTATDSSIDGVIRQQIIQVLADHQRWKRGEPLAQRADLRHFDLSTWKMDGLDLSNAEMSGVSLQGASLAKANLSGSTLIMADLEGANLRDANLMGADLRGARLHRADLSGARLEGANLGRGGAAEGGTAGRRTDLSNAAMNFAIMVNATLTECDMTGADLTSADIDGADLRQSILVNANFEDVRADFARFEGANVFGAEMDDSVRGSILAQGGSDTLPPLRDDPGTMLAAHLAWLKSNGKEGQRCILDMVDLSGHDFDDMDLTSAVIRRCDLHGASLKGARLVLADLSESDLRQADLSNAVLDGCILRRANLAIANLRGAKFGLIEVEGRDWPVNLERARLHGATFDEARFERTLFRGTRTSVATVRALSRAGVPAAVLRNSRRVVVEK